MTLYFIDNAPLCVPELELFWRDPEPFHAAERDSRARCHGAIDAGMRPLNDKQAARWAAESED